MLCSIKRGDELENLKELISLQSQVKALRLQDKLGKQIFHEDMKKVFEPVPKSIKGVFEDVTKNNTENSIENNKALTNLNDKLSEIMNDRGISESYLLSPLSKITNPEHSSQFKLVNDPSSKRVSDLLINKTIPVTLYKNFLRFQETDKEFELQGDLLKMITNKNYTVDVAKLSDKKMYELAKEMYFGEKSLGNRSTRDNSLIRLLQSPAIMAGSLKKSNTRWLSTDPNELCDKLKFLLQEKQAGNISDTINEEIIATADNL